MKPRLTIFKWPPNPNTRSLIEDVCQEQILSGVLEGGCLVGLLQKGGVANGGLRGVWPRFLEIGLNRTFSTFFCLFRPFPEGATSTWEIQKMEEKRPFTQISPDLIKPPSLKLPFAALQPRKGVVRTSHPKPREPRQPRESRNEKVKTSPSLVPWARRLSDTN